MTIAADLRCRQSYAFLPFSATRSQPDGHIRQSRPALLTCLAKPEATSSMDQLARHLSHCVNGAAVALQRLRKTHSRSLDVRELWGSMATNRNTPAGSAVNGTTSAPTSPCTEKVVKRGVCWSGWRLILPVAADNAARAWAALYLPVASPYAVEDERQQNQSGQQAGIPGCEMKRALDVLLAAASFHKCWEACDLTFFAR